MILGFIGLGNMASSIISGLSLTAFSNVYAYDPAESSEEKAKNYKVDLLDKNKSVVLKSDIIVIAVKPQYLNIVIDEIKSIDFTGKIIVSIIAGVKVDAFKELKGAKVVRTMPNTPALIRRGITAILKNPSLTDDENAKIESIFSGIGKFLRVDIEEKMDAITALSGSGPAYFYTFIEGLIMAGVKAGLPYDLSYELAVETGIGSLVMMRETKENPAELRNKVSSPAGTTIYALSLLEKRGFKGDLIDAVFEAYKRSVELGK